MFTALPTCQNTGASAHQYSASRAEAECVEPSEDELMMIEDDDVIDESIYEPPMIEDSARLITAEGITLSEKIWDDCEKLGIQPDELEIPDDIVPSFRNAW